MPLLLIDTELCEILRLTINQYLILQTLNKSEGIKSFQKVIDWNENDVNALKAKGYILDIEKPANNEVTSKYALNPNLNVMLNNWVDEFTKLYAGYPAYKKGKSGETIPLKGNKEACHKQYIKLTGSNIKLQKALGELTRQYIAAEEGSVYIKTLLGWLNSMDMETIISYVNESNIDRKEEQIL